jgi:DUF438 domain-containing protein
MLKLFHLPYRQIEEGITQGHAKGSTFYPRFYNNKHRIINKLNIPINSEKDKISKADYIIIAIGGTGIKVTNRGQWIRETWHIKNNNKKEYLKIHVAVNIKTKKILSMMKVTDIEHVHDSKALPELVNGIIESDNVIVAIGKLYVDGSYDDINDIFRFLADNGGLPYIKIRKNARIR